jgi:CHAT domain-containing protein/tetratricopeptide (TPR) repeat protein
MTVLTKLTRALALAALLVCATTGIGAQQPVDPQSPDARRLDDQLTAAWKINLTAEPARAQAAFEQIRLEAERLGLTRQVAASLRGMATVESSQERVASAKNLLQRALDLYHLAGDELGEARALRQLGTMVGIQGEKKQGLDMLAHARETFARLDDKHDLAMTYRAALYLMDGDERADFVDEAIAAARAANDINIECSVRHAWGDGHFTHGNYAAAYQILSEALACYEKTDQIADKGRVLVSLGRVERAHGQLERALSFYQQAYALQQEAHDEPAALQSMNAIGVAYSYMDRREDARAIYEQALERAKALGSERYISFLTGSLGDVYYRMGQFEKARELLEQALTIDKAAARVYRYMQLADTLNALDRLDEALEAVNKSVALAGEEGEARVNALAIRASILQRMNRLDASDADLRDSLRLIEDMRSKTLAQDLMKRGFGTTTQSYFAAAIDVRNRRGDARGALELAEQARSRAFLDLLASRRNEPKVVGVVASTKAMEAQNGVPTGLLASAAHPASTSSLAASLPTRGSASSDAVNSDATAGNAVAPYLPPSLDVESPRNAAAPTGAEMIATATRLRSTLLVYWVAPRTTLAWVITPTGEIHSSTIHVDSTHLAELARATTSPLKDGGAGLALLGGSQLKPWRELYALLIKPVREFLPSTPGSLVTIVPHGPLFQVSFAGMQDEAGKYLIESYRLHYTPSVGVLAYTAADLQPRPAVSRALLVGDPSPPMSDPGDEELASLPWARREVTEIGAVLGPRRAQVITEQNATEARVRSEIESADLLHFATHGVIRQSESMSSFLALARPADIAGAGKADGKLTADEVYGLHLHADLVVLSACGTALGPMSAGDGVIGFTRAFLYAGARSVIATEWNVPDQTGYEVMRRFYRFRKASNDTSEALREAQLAVLGALRGGKLRVDTPGGTVALRENPLFWAGFVLVGKP